LPGETNDNEGWLAELENYSPYAFTGEGPDRKREDFALYGSVVPGFAGGGNARTGPFAVSDLIELLTFHGANDPEVFSALEQAFTLATDPDEPTRSLLRSDRTLDAEIGVEVSNATGPTLTPEELNLRARRQLDIRSLLTTVSGARPIRTVTTDAAGILTIDAGQRRFRADELMLAGSAYEGTSGTIGAPGGVNANLIEQNQARNPLIENGFEVYLRTLAPHLDEFTDSTAWPPVGPPAPSLADNTRTLFYGHAGPELALRIAAHMAVNFRDSADRPFIDVNPNDGVPDPGALVIADADPDLGEIAIDQNGDGTIDPDEYALRRDEPSRALVWTVQDSERTPATLDVLEQLLDVNNDDIVDRDDIAILDADEVLDIPAGETVLADAAAPTTPALGQSQTSDALIVYGVEAQPFLSEVFYYNAYWDAPRGGLNDGPGFGSPFWAVDPITGAVGEDSDWLQENPDHGEYDVSEFAGFQEFLDGRGVIRGASNIDGTVEDDNRDFLFQLVVFQIFNPFDVPVSMRNFYVEFGEYLYRPRPLIGTEEGFVLDPGETRLLFATNPGFALPAVTVDTDISDPALQGSAYESIGQRIQDALQQAEMQNRDFLQPTSLTGPGVPPQQLAFEIIESLVPDDERVPLRRYEFDASTQSYVELGPDPADFRDLLVGDRAAHGDDDVRNRVALLWWDLGDRFEPGATGQTIEWRRDDVLADRIADTSPPGAPVLDQRLDLGQLAFDVLDPEGDIAGVVNDAL
ncbi:MAG: hypothetical protein AAFN41_11595, partial [Planctomycetota bacterium]